jgi:hypothetical protein
LYPCYNLLKEDKAMNRTCTGIIAVCFVLSAAGLSGSDPPPVGFDGDGWHGWSMNMDETRPPRNTGLEQAEFTELLTIIGEIGMLFRRMPSLNPPVGVEVSPNRSIFKRVGLEGTHRQGIKSNDTTTPELHPLKIWPPEGGRGEAEKGPVRGEFSLGIYRPVFTFRNPRCTVRVQINDPWLEGRIIFEDTIGGIYLPWPLDEDQKGRIRYRVDKETVIEKLLPRGREPWIPVSQERWIRALIEKSQEMLETHRSDIVEGRDQRRTRFMRGYETMKKLNPDQAETMLKNFETGEEVYTRQAEAIASEEWDALEAAQQRGLAMVGRHLSTLKEELASLSSTDLAAPAFGFEQPPQMYWMPRGKPKRPSLLLEANDPEAFPLLTPNPDFFRSDLPPTAVQSITIINKLWEEYDDAMNRELDWEALKGMVE